MINVEVIYDLISQSTLTLVAYPFIELALKPSAYSLTFTAATALCCFLSSVIKRLVFVLYPHPWLLRPPHARNCDYMCRNGLCGGKSGFPSGHVASATLFVAFIILYNLLIGKIPLTKQVFLLSTGACIIILTGIARYKKGCHNIIQIIGGFILGLVVAGISIEALMMYSKIT